MRHVVSTRAAARAKSVTPVPEPGVPRPVHAARRSGSIFGPRTADGRVLQAKLRIGDPDDRYEREADRMADAVLGMGSLDAGVRDEPGETAPPSIQRRCAACEEELAGQSMVQRLCAACEQKQLQAKGAPGTAPGIPPGVESRIQALRGGGTPLPARVRAYFEPRFAQDFSRVRVHTDEDSAAALGARAYTVGTDIVFGRGQYAPDHGQGRRLLAHELTHVVQQGAATGAVQGTSDPVLQRVGDPAAIPPGLPCPTDLTTGRPAGEDIRFPVGGSTITAAHTTQLQAVVAGWLAAGGTDELIVHGYASTDGDQGPNWTLSCDRAEAVQTELERLGVPAVRISVLAHGESTDFGGAAADNRHAVVSTRGAGLLPNPLLVGTLTARDNFSGRSTSHFGVGEVIDLDFVSLPPRPAADFGGLRWVLVSGGGTLAGTTNRGTGTYTAPAAAATVQLELRVDSGATAGRVVSAHAIDVVEPDGVNMTAVPGSAPSFGGHGAPPIPAGTFGAGFRANVFVDPKDVSFQGVVFGEGTVAAVVTPAGSHFSPFAGTVHGLNTFGPAHGGNAATGTAVSPPVDGIFSGSPAPAGSLFGTPVCTPSDFLWAIPWEFSVSGSPRRAFATANHHATASLFCNCTIEKAGAGPFCRRIDGTVC